MIGEIIVTVLGIAWGPCFGALIYCNHKVLDQNRRLIEYLDELTEQYKDAIALERARRKL